MEEVYQPATFNISGISLGASNLSLEPHVRSLRIALGALQRLPVNPQSAIIDKERNARLRIDTLLRQILGDVIALSFRPYSLCLGEEGTLAAHVLE